MVQDPGKALRTDSLKPVNIPGLVEVEEDSRGLPATVRLKRKQAVAAIEDRWRIDDEWWRGEEAISRLYIAVIFSSGQRLVLYKDLIRDCWYRQNC
ncbi:MAG: hypothetical protein JXA46_02680 [Dehalococcoidales bacterium]|nr:hypothetical protein [Dehalococcoidales bacterium]